MSVPATAPPISPSAPPAEVSLRRVSLATTHTVQCPHGHHIRQDTMVLEHAGLRCKHKQPAPKGRGHLGECGAWVYVARVPEMNAGVREIHGAEAQAVIVLGASYPEVARWQRENLSRAEILEETGAITLLGAVTFS